MAIYKNQDTGTGYVICWFTDWKGERKQKCKRGFPTKRAAADWEREFLMQKQANIDMTLESFVKLYEQDVKPKLKLKQYRNGRCKSWKRKEKRRKTKTRHRTSRIPQIFFFSF